MIKPKRKASSRQPSQPKLKPILNLIPYLIIIGIFAIAVLAQTGYITLPHINLGQSYKIPEEATVGVHSSYEFSELIPLLGPKSSVGTDIYTFYLGSGVGFPPMGLTLGIDGVLKGTPTAKGTSKFQVCVKDVGGRSACRTYSLAVNPAGTPVNPTSTPKKNSTCRTTSAQWGIPCGQGGVSGLPVPDSCDCPSDTYYSGTTDRITKGGPYKICTCK